VLSEAAVRELLVPFGVDLHPSQLSKLLIYLELLLRWNRRINLTAIRDPALAVTRHFGESLYLRRWVALQGSLLDIGSGAGFPGLALKIVFPELAVTLLEPVAKKRAFLKEVARTCSMEHVEVRGERLEDFVRSSATLQFDTGTARAVGKLDQLVPLAARCLGPAGQLILWLSHEQATDLKGDDFDWGRPIPIPLSRQGEIWLGMRKPPRSP
jgi:16S rRNA (guanine527-N7)-methyltransferase